MRVLHKGLMRFLLELTIYKSVKTKKNKDLYNTVTVVFALGHHFLKRHW